MSAVQPSYVGLDMVAALNTAGPGITPATLSVINCKDLKRGRQRGKADASNRGSKFKLSEPSLKDEEIAFDMDTDETDAVYTALRTAYDAGSPVEIWMGNGPLGTAGTVASGGTANVVYNVIVMKVFGFDVDEPLDGACTTSITLAPCKKTQTVAPISNSLIA
jgi:hypothetical protein